MLRGVRGGALRVLGRLFGLVALWRQRRRRINGDAELLVVVPLTIGVAAGGSAPHAVVVAPLVSVSVVVVFPA
jgi:hypothetical protein